MLPPGPYLTAKFHQMGRRAEFQKPLADAVHGIPGGDPAQVDLDASLEFPQGCAGLCRGGPRFDQSHANPTTRCSDHVGGWLEGPSAPQLHERTDGDVEGAVRLLVDVVGRFHERQEIRRHRHPFIRSRPIEPAGIGIIPPCVRRPVDPREHRLHVAMHLTARHAGYIGGKRHPIGRAHRRPGERGQLRSRTHARKRCQPPNLGNLANEPNLVAGTFFFHDGHQCTAAAMARQLSSRPSRHENRSARRCSRR